MLRNNFSQMNRVSRSVGQSPAEMRLKPHKRWDDEGVASTVGTIMALMVFLAFLSMFTSQYVPIWMEENEASHMSEAYGQFAAMKQAVDMQILAGSIQGTSPVKMFSPITLGANGIPMFASPTPGFLSVQGGNSFTNVSFAYEISVSNTTVVQTVNRSAGGSIQLNVPNRYFIPQTLAYEGDALILMQADGEYMKAMPQFDITRASANTYYISFTQMDLRCDDSSYIGFGTRGVQTSSRAVTTTTYSNITDNSTSFPSLNITQYTKFGAAWSSAFNQTFQNARMSWGTDYTIESKNITIPNSIEKYYEITVLINPDAVSRFSLTVAVIEVSTAEMGAA